MRKLLLIICAAAVLMTGCGTDDYRHITQDEALRIIKFDPRAILLDVRTQEEYCKKHITDAVLLPVEDMRAGVLSKLADKDATIIVYCLIGKRSKEAASILTAHGYKNVFEMGAIEPWKGKFMGTDLNN